MRIAKYKCLEFGYETFSDGGLDDAGSYVRISEFVDVEFPPLTSDEQIQKHVSALDRTRESVVEEFSRKLAAIDRKKSELLAITHQQ